ncbi:MAG: hypothetical protein KJZ86_13805 [Caldilineaceae bacterium]|nr:hypothetical protein [Caldilineaceae bacterium]HRJ40590.1 hypothetical protein [Caldilineaceae bacterium]
MLTFLRSPAGLVRGFTLLAVAVAALLWLAPAERTLGTGMRSVYLHVGLIWAGIAGFTVAGLLGLWIVLWDDARLERWAQIIGWVACAFFAAGFLSSMLASSINWGGVFLAEPRNVSALMVLSVALIVQIWGSWPVWTRLKGALRVALVAIFTWSNLTTPLVLHPQNPIRTSTSTAIQYAFLGIFLIFFLAGALVVIAVRGEGE